MPRQPTRAPSLARHVQDTQRQQLRFSQATANIPVGNPAAVEAAATGVALSTTPTPVLTRTISPPVDATGLSIHCAGHLGIYNTSGATREVWVTVDISGISGWPQVMQVANTAKGTVAVSTAQSNSLAKFGVTDGVDLTVTAWTTSGAVATAPENTASLSAILYWLKAEDT